MNNEEQYIQMYQSGTNAEDLFQIILFDTDSTIQLSDVKRWLKIRLGISDELLLEITRNVVESIDTKYRRLKEDDGLTEEEIFRLAYVDLNERRLLAIGILRRVFDLNIGDASWIAWTTLDKIREDSK